MRLYQQNPNDIAQEFVARQNGGLRSANPSPQLVRPTDTADQMFSRWNMQSALSTPIQGARGITANQRNAMLAYDEQQFQRPLDIAKANNEATLGFGKMQNDTARTGLVGKELGLRSQEQSTKRLGALSGLTRMANPISSALEPASEPEGYAKGGVIGDVQKDDGGDQVPVVAREGEYFLNPETVAHIGGGNYQQGLRSLNALVEQATGQKPGPTPMPGGEQGLAAGGYVDSPERQQWLRTIASQGNRDPEAQASLKAYNEAPPPVTPAPQPARISIPRLPDEPRPVPPTLRERLDARTQSNLQQMAQGRAEEQANGTTLGNAVRSVTGLRQRMQDQTNSASPEQLGQPGNTAPAPKSDLSLIDFATGQIPDSPPDVQAPAKATVPVQTNAVQTSEGTLGAPPAPTDEAGWRAQHAAADQYRNAWQERAPSGLRGADSDALTLYNAENYTRGTGVQAQRQANGNLEFSDSGLRRTPQYLDAANKPTSDWRNTAQYRDAALRNASSGDERLQGLGAAQVANLPQQGANTGDPEMDRLVSRYGAKEGAAIYKAMNADGKKSKAAAYSEQQNRIKDALGEDVAAKAMPEIQQAQMQMASQLIKAGASQEEAEAAVQNGQFMAKLANAYKLREELRKTGAFGDMGVGAGVGALAGLAAAGGTYALTRSPSAAKKAGLMVGGLGAGAGAAGGYAGGVQGFNQETPLNEMMNLQATADGAYTIGNSVIPKSFVQKHFQLFGLSAPPA